MAAILLRKQEERERAKREMECIERERERERKLEQERRVKRMAKKMQNTTLLANLATVREEVVILLGDDSQKNHFHHIKEMTKVISVHRWVEDTRMKSQSKSPKQIKVFRMLIVTMKLETSLVKKNFRKWNIKQGISFHFL